MSKPIFTLGLVLLVFSMFVAAMPLGVTLQDPARQVTIYPNTLFAVPLILLGTLLLLFGLSEGSRDKQKMAE